MHLLDGATRPPAHGGHQGFVAPLLVGGLAAIGALCRLDVVPIRSYGVLFVALFAWLGLRVPRRTSVKVLPLFAVAYVVPLIGLHPRLDPRALVVTLGTGVFVAERIAAAQARAGSARASADRSAAAFRIVAETSASLQQLEPEAVLDSVVDGIMALGYDGANLVVIDDRTERFALIHPRGLAVELSTEWQPIGSGMTAAVRESRRPLVVADYRSWEHSVEFYRHSGVRTLVGVPMLAGPRLVGVLVASTRSPHEIVPSDVEALEALSLVAGAAMLNVERYQDQRSVAEAQALAAMTDELTDLPNRRSAERVLQEVAAGTALVMVDVDHFRDVNARLGHAGGDVVLQAIAAHLADRLRTGDFLARFGGEELLLVLPDTDLQTASGVVERLAASWRATRPEATFSAGVALHFGGAAEHTLARADAALYEAKHTGRDRWVVRAV